MKKKLVLILMVMIIGIFLFLDNVCKISILESVKQIVIGQAKMFDNEKNIKKNTVVDVTYLEDNVNIGHEHIFKTMYDENGHWQECTVCKTKQNQNAHSFTDNGWTHGADSCLDANVHKFSCKCGYSYSNTIGKPSHQLEYVNYNHTYSRSTKCTKCNSNNKIHDCYRKTDGVKIDCLHLGTCKFCGYNYTKSNSRHGIEYINSFAPNEEILCPMCNTKLCSYNYVRVIKDSDKQYRLQASVNCLDGNICNNITTHDHITGKHSILETQTTNNGTSCIIERKITYDEYVEDGGRIQVNFWGTKNGTNTVFTIYGYIIVDETKPTISKIAMGNGEEELTEWSKTKPIIIDGEENYCKSVTIKIVDENENKVFEGTASVDNQNYSISCTPELEVDTSGKTFKAIVTDSCGNTIEKEFTISKVDAVPPTPTSDDKILGDWAKSKDFTFMATDYGIGQVKIAFNDIEDLELATEEGKTFSRYYKFTGDVYHEKELSVLYKDGLGNTSVQKIRIDKIDNTTPTITNMGIHNNKLTVTSHDEHKKLGEGSGVTKYRYLASETKLTNPKITSENSIEVNKDDEIIVDEIYKMKYIYVVAEDYVGNVSEVYEFEVPQLVLTSTVNLNTTDRKGEIILDWSTYDITDKYFVVYRKQDNQANWDEIVPLTTKLTGSTYTDILGNDKAKPKTPNITITGDATKNNINVTASSIDDGTKYKYYIEAYDINSNSLINISNMTN